MEQMMEEILGYLRHDKLEVRKQAVSAVFQYSDNPEVIQYIKKSDMMKALKACLYDLVSLQSFGLAGPDSPISQIANFARTWCTRLCW